uniref:Four helix bundle protein n=1 Tax=Panagrolaimus davidi TaxID=227884 RepID=A0A914QWX6_9BILA
MISQFLILVTMKEQYLNDDGQAKAKRIPEELQKEAKRAEMKLWIAAFNLVAACIRDIPRKRREMEEEIEKEMKFNR